MSRRFAVRSVMAVGAFAALAACSDSPVVPGHPEPVGVEVFQRGTTERLAYIHGDHWHGRIELTHGEEVEVDVHFLDAAGNVIPLSGGYTVRASIATGQPENVVDVHSHGDHLDLEGVGPGETRVVLQFMHGTHVEWTAPALRVVVQSQEPAAAEVYLRGTDQRLAYVHGTHWHGRIELDAGDEVEVDVRFLDGEGNVIALGGAYTVRAEIAPDHPTGIASVASHGDHLDIEGDAAGETRIIIHFWYDGAAAWTAPALRVVVN
jgi:hypothetical protein